MLTELMQYRIPVVSRGPSGNTWPKWPPHLAHVTSTRRIPYVVSSWFCTLPSMAWSKLGHPQCESNFVPDVNNWFPHAAHTYVPSSLLLTYLPVNAGSVPFCRSTRYCSGVSSFFHCSSVFCTFVSSVIARVSLVVVSLSCIVVGCARPQEATPCTLLHGLRI